MTTRNASRKIADYDLAGLNKDELVAEIMRLRAGIREHRDASGQALWTSFMLASSAIVGPIAGAHSAPHRRAGMASLPARLPEISRSARSRITGCAAQQRGISRPRRALKPSKKRGLAASLSLTIRVSSVSCPVLPDQDSCSWLDSDSNPWSRPWRGCPSPWCPTPPSRRCRSPSDYYSGKHPSQGLPDPYL